VDGKSGRTLIEDPRFYCPAEVDTLIGSPEKAAQQLGWRAQVMLPELVSMMVEGDDRRVSEGDGLR
jgi:GDPmannose 4,6-dehydratase